MPSDKNEDFPRTVTTITGVRYTQALRDLLFKNKRGYITFIVTRDPALKGKRPRAKSLLPDKVYGPDEWRHTRMDDVFVQVSKSLGGPSYTNLILWLDRVPAMCVTLDVVGDTFEMYPLSTKPLRTDVLGWFSGMGRYELDYVLQRCGTDWIVVSGPEMVEEPMTEDILKRYRKSELLAKEYAHRLGYRMDTAYVTHHVLTNKIEVADHPRQKDEHGS